MLHVIYFIDSEEPLRSTSHQAIDFVGLYGRTSNETSQVLSFAAGQRKLGFAGLVEDKVLVSISESPGAKKPLVTLCTDIFPSFVAFEGSFNGLRFRPSPEKKTNRTTKRRCELVDKILEIRVPRFD